MLKAAEVQDGQRLDLCQQVGDPIDCTLSLCSQIHAG